MSLKGCVHTGIMFVCLLEWVCYSTEVLMWVDSVLCVKLYCNGGVVSCDVSVT